MRFKIDPYPHQLAALELSRKHQDFALLWEMGTGKTGGLINILRDKYSQRQRMMKTLILSPLVTLYNWQNEFELHSWIAKERVHVLYARSSAAKAKIFEKAVMNPVTLEFSGQEILITNYETLRSKDMFDRILEWAPEIVICDEAHMIKNPSAKTTKAVIKIGDRAIHRYLLTGTLILNSVKDVFAPWRFLDKGETFGRNQSVFEREYLEDENAAWSNKPGYFPKLVARPEKYCEITNKIFQKATRVTKADVLKDLPPLVKVRRTVELGKEQAKYYKEMERDFVTFVREKKKNSELSGAVVAQLAVTKALRLQQIVTGYVSTEDGENIYIENNPRLEATRNLLEEIVIGERHKCILWCSFRANYKMLGDLCSKLEINHVFLTGEMNLKEKRDAMDRFNSDDTCRVIIANRRAGGIGINLVAASYSIVYSRNFSLGDELQSEARNHRGGSQIHDKITKIDLCAKDTIDELVLEALNNKQDLAKKIVDLADKL